MWKVVLFSVFLATAGAVTYKVTDQVYFDVVLPNQQTERIVLGLFGEIAPKTVRNFIHAATKGFKGKNYAGTRFHRIIPRFMIQGGDIENNDGSGSVSLYGKFFDDETFEVKHSGPGFLSMANQGENTNGCQFFITTMATPWLDGKHVAFGKVVEGNDIVHKIEHVKTDSDDKPIEPVVITKSGFLRTKEPFYVSDQPYDAMAWVKASILPLGFSFSVLAFFHWVIKKLEQHEDRLEKEQ